MIVNLKKSNTNNNNSDNNNESLAKMFTSFSEEVKEKERVESASVETEEISILLHHRFDVQLSIFPEQTGWSAARVWGSAIALSELIVTNREKLKTRVVLELGSGTGLVGITAMQCGLASKATILTDCAVPAIISNLKKNVGMNRNVPFLFEDMGKNKIAQRLQQHFTTMIAPALLFASFGLCPPVGTSPDDILVEKAFVETLDWNHHSSLSSTKCWWLRNEADDLLYRGSGEDEVNLIIFGSDLVYSKDAISPLVKILLLHLDSSPKINCVVYLLSPKSRRELEDLADRLEDCPTAAIGGNARNNHRRVRTRIQNHAVDEKHSFASSYCPEEAKAGYRLLTVWTEHEDPTWSPPDLLE